ncbi:FliO/MopB family protein [Immundisolibacter sp.]
MRRVAILLLCPVPAVAAPSVLAASGQMVASLALVVALIGGLFVLLRRFQVRTGSASGIRALAALSVGTRERVVLLEVAGQQVLVGVAPGRVQALLVLGDNANLSVSPPAEPFAARLDAALSGNAQAVP